MAEGRRQSRHERWARKLLLGAGVIEIAVGALHFAMPSQAYRSTGFATLRPAELGFVTLVTLAVGILLLAFGSFTAYLASQGKAPVEILFGYSLIQAFLWVGRVILEAAYPVRLRLFSVEPFTAVVMPGLLFEMALFVASTVLARKAMVAGAPGEVPAG